MYTRRRGSRSDGWTAPRGDWTDQTDRAEFAKSGTGVPKQKTAARGGRPLVIFSQMGVTEQLGRRGRVS